jgi:hypothetical protein
MGIEAVRYFRGRRPGLIREEEDLDGGAGDGEGADERAA